AFCPPVVYSFYVPLSLPHMSSRSQSVGDAVVPKFDMHIYPFVMTPDEVKNLVVEYAIPLDLHPCVPPSGLTMNRLPIDKIVATSMSQFLKFPMAGGVHVGKGTTLAANEVLTAKRKAQVAKDREAGKRAAAKGASQQTKRKKTTPLSFALSDSEVDKSNRSGSGTHHSAYPLNNIIPNEGELATSLILEPVDQMEEDTDQPLDNVEDTTKVHSFLFEHSPQFQQSNPSDEGTHLVRSESGPTHTSGSTGHRVSSTFGGSHRLAFPARHPGGDDAGSSLWRDAGLTEPFALQRSLFELGRGALAQIDMLQRYEALNEDYGELFESHWSCRDVRLGCVGKEAGLTEKLAAVEKARDDLLDRNREREERIKQLEVDLASKTSSFAKAEGVVGTLQGDLERLTLDLSYAKIVRHNYIHQLLPTMVQRLLSNGEYKKSLTDVFNLAIAAGWCHLAIGSWTHSERLAFRVTGVTCPLALGLIRNVLHSGSHSGMLSLPYRVLPTSDPTCLGPPLYWLHSFGTPTRLA
ncbi:hypothetical protein Tco_1324392, partial [Tanacetum coccineum]